MPLRSLFGTLLRSTGRANDRVLVRRKRRLSFESLESRQLLTASATYSAGALYVTGDSGNNYIEFNYSNGYVWITDNGTPIAPANLLPSSVSAITIAGAGGDDTIKLHLVSPGYYTQLYQPPIVDGGDGNDTIHGSQLSDSLHGASGNDTILGLEGSDTLFGGDGADILYGDYGSNNAPNSGPDNIYGELGDDWLYGDQGNDALNGGPGNDRLKGDDGNDSLHGAQGDDWFWYAGATDSGLDTITEYTNDGYDGIDFSLLVTAVSIDIGRATEQTVGITDGPGYADLRLVIQNPTALERVQGSRYDDLIIGNSNSNRLDGDQGADRIEGREGNDTIYGDGPTDSYYDILIGGPGDDTLDGGSSGDGYIFTGNPSDLAIQGDGFFIVESTTGERLYTRNGIFKTNAENELVTITGNPLLGYGLDDDFNIEATILEPLTIPYGAAVAEATENVAFLGVLTPTGDVATTAEIIESAVLGDGSYVAPAPGGTASIDPAPAPVGALAGGLNGAYTYYITYKAPGVPESRPVRFSDTITITNGHVQLSDLPAPVGHYAGGTVAIYRNPATNSNVFFQVAEIDVAAGNDYVDGMDDATLVTRPAIDFNGPKINPSTPLVNVTRWEGLSYIHPFVVGELAFSATKGGSSSLPRTLQIVDGASATTVAELANFMAAAFGIHTTADDPAMPGSIDESTGLTIAPGANIDTTAGTINFVGNNGVDNAVSAAQSAYRMTSTTGVETRPNLAFTSVQDAIGQSAMTSFIVYDSLGIELNVRVTAVLESTSSVATMYRWFAESSGNHSVSSTDITVGTGLIRFDGQGKLIDVSNSKINIDRSGIASVSPLVIELDFSHVSGLSADEATLSAKFQDGFGPGTLSSYIIGEDGTIRGVFTNGATRNLGQIRLARFANPAGLDYRGQNMFALGVNSGLPIEGNPGQQGIGEIIAGAIER